MGKSKEKRAKSLLRSSTFPSNNEFTSFEDEVIQHLQLLEESNGLVIGFNAVVRSTKRNALSVVMYISRRGVSAMYHALNLMCKGKDVLFLQLQDINTNVFRLKIATSYGIKKNILDQPQFSKLLEKMNLAKNSRKNQKERPVENLNEEFCAKSFYEDMKSETPSKSTELSIDFERLCEDTACKNPFSKNDVNCFIHPKHDKSNQNYSGKEGMLNFQEVDFPNYKTNQMSIKGS